MIIICLFLRFSAVRIFLNTVAHTKKATRGGTLGFQTPFQGNILGGEELRL
jgi:hypothetical protein